MMQDKSQTVVDNDTRPELYMLLFFSPLLEEIFNIYKFIKCVIMHIIFFVPET